MFNKTVAIAEASGLPFFVVDEHLQKGITFGEKFSNAIEMIFSRGFKKVIAIGSDAALLDTDMLMCASQAMSSGKNVLGQDSHGGIYLLGIHKKAYAQSLSYKIQWQTNQVFNELLDYFDTNGNGTFILPQLQDVNEANEISELVFNAESNKFLNLLRAIFASKNQHAGRLYVFNFSKKSITPFSLRGPPVFEYFSRVQNKYSTSNTSAWYPFLKNISLFQLLFYIAYPA